MEKYFIFSDESGTWNSKDVYYLRSWILVPSENLGDFLISQDTKSYIKSFFTIVKLSEFYSERYRIRTEIDSALANIFFNLKNILKDYMKKIPKEVKGAVNKILFLNIYEKYCWVNAINYLGLGSEKIQKVFIDSPQFNKKEYLEILTYEGIRISKDKVNIVKSANLNKRSVEYKGLLYADKYVSLLRKLLEERLTEKKLKDFADFYKETHIEKGNIIPGIEKVFRRDEMIANRLIKLLKD